MSGTSASGVGKVRTSSADAQTSFCPSQAVGSPSQRRHEKHRHQEMKACIGMRGEAKRLHVVFGNGDPEFLAQFARKCGLRAFTRLHLASRKFPQSRHRLALGPLGQQQAGHRPEQAPPRRQSPTVLRPMVLSYRGEREVHEAVQLL